MKFPVTTLLSLCFCPLVFSLPINIKELSLLTRFIVGRQSSVVNKALALISTIFPLNVTIKAGSGLITTADTALAAALNLKTSQDDLKDGGDCGDLITLFVRGTSEPGNVGVIVGPFLIKALSDSLGSQHSLSVQGLDYDASVEGFLEGGSSSGSQALANLVTETAQKCKNSKIVISGYSQGGQVIHNAAKQLSDSTLSVVNSVVIFGDPNHGSSVNGVSSDKALIICNSGDDICAQGDLILLPHLTYAGNVDQATSFIIKQAGLS